VLRARVLECCSFAGDSELDAPRSLWDAAVKVAVAALSGHASVRGVPRSWCIAALLDMLRALGFRVFRAGDRVEVEYSGEGKRRVYLNVDCGLHYAALGLAIASRYLRPPQQLILRAQSEHMLHASLRALLELASSLGLRAWPGGSLSKLVIVEPTSPKPSSTPVRLTSKYAYTVAAALLAAASYGGSVYNSYGASSPYLLGSRRLATVKHVLLQLGVIEYASDNLVKLGSIEGFKGELRVEGGYIETLTLLSLLSACKSVAGLKVNGLPPREHPDANDLLYLSEVMGYKTLLDCKNDSCTLTMEREEGAKPLSLTYTVHEQPDLLYPLSAYIAVAREAAISGLKSFDAELPASKNLEAVLQKLGFEAYLEDGDDRLVVLGVREAETAAVEGGVPQSCPAIAVACLPILAHNIVKCRGAVEGVERVDNQLPGVLEALLQAGLPLDIT
jgi:hypothetical protein